MFQIVFHVIKISSIKNSGCKILRLKFFYYIHLESSQISCSFLVVHWVLAENEQLILCGLSEMLQLKIFITGIRIFYDKVIYDENKHKEQKFNNNNLILCQDHLMVLKKSKLAKATRKKYIKATSKVVIFRVLEFNMFTCILI